MLGICSSVRCSVGINNIQISGMAFRLPFVCLSIRVDKACKREGEWDRRQALLFPLLSSIKPIGHYAMLGCPARGPGPGPARPRVVYQSYVTTKRSREKNVKVKVCCGARVGGAFNCLPITPITAIVVVVVIVVDVVVCYRFHSTICIEAVKFLLHTQTTNWISKVRAAALRCVSGPVFLPPVSLASSLSCSLPLFPLSVYRFVCARKYIMLNKLLCTVWGLHLAADE